MKVVPAFTPEEIFLVLISVRDPRAMSMKISNDTIGN
jgi:hypothetical protein